MFSSYAQLMAMLAEGWELESPVYVRPRRRTRSRSGNETTYHFVLWRRGQVKLVSVIGGPEVEHFLTDGKLAVDRL